MGAGSVFSPDIDLQPYRSGSAEPWTAALIGDLICAKKPHKLLETGTFLGMTTKVMHQAMQTYAHQHGSHLSTIDCDLERAQAFGKEVADWMGYMTVGVEVLHGDALGYIMSLENNSIDFAFVDDDHTASHVDAEITALIPKMRMGGIVCMHDVVGPYGLGEVCKKHGGIVLDLERLHVAGGLGLIAL